MGIASHSTEDRRQQEQTRLDNLKTAPERNKWGQFATPPALALSLARYAHTLMGKAPVRFLDPAIGTGSFFSAALQAFGQKHIAAATGIELDPLFSKTAATLWEEQGLQVIKGDFTKQRTPQQRFNLVLTNPPYVRHHHLPAADKNRLKAQLLRSLHLDISGLAGLYCYFLLLCHDWMEGLAIWLVPSEFMDVNYGVTLRRYLSEHVTLLHIHRFCPTDVQFTDALVSSAVIVFRKAPPPAGHAARFSLAGPIEQPQKEADVPLDTLRRSRKWTQFPANTTVSDTGELTLGAIFAIKRGLATGSNSFFILTEEDIKHWQVPRQFMKAILPGPRHVTGDIIDALPDGAPDVSPRRYLLDCKEPEEHIEATWPRFYEYLQTGKVQKIHEAYLSSHRVPWYSQEQRPPAPFLCTYMGRSRDGKHPFRFIWNRSQATAHNVYLMLYPKGPLRAALKAHPELYAQVFEALQRITPAQLLSEGRVYGGGLYKVEPKELAQIPVRLILDSIGRHVRIEEQMPMLFT
ncbi:MAG: N-6 DNA methylase [Candidatus Sulfopaludibacter sp.]|nr:N-6 DNA methylase [Candidatus Sulfopaludibacter sp.]